jgi:hypothetical protein
MILYNLNSLENCFLVLHPRLSFKDWSHPLKCKEDNAPISQFLCEEGNLTSVAALPEMWLFHLSWRYKTSTFLLGVTLILANIDGKGFPYPPSEDSSAQERYGGSYL